MRLTIIGAGYVGLVTGTCFADLGNEVICADNDARKIALLNEGGMPIYEPGLAELVKRNRQDGRLTFTTDIETGIKDSEAIFICVGTPSREDGSADLTSVEKVSRVIAEHIDSYKLVVEKSTVPVETSDWIKKTINTFKKNGCEFDVASNPEFLREGSAVKDFMNPDRIVIGVQSKKAENLLRELYSPIETKIVVTDIKGAEIIKHASNSFLATKISFINAVSNLCERTGTDINAVAEGIGMDSRINKHFLKAGAGFGGSCFPKDLKAFIHISEKLGYSFDLLKEVEKINDEQKSRIMVKVKDLLWNLPDKTVAIWGLAFKPDTDDIRSAPSMEIIKRLIKEKAKVRVFDPKAMDKVKTEIGEDITYCEDIYDAAREADCVILMTEWNEFKEIDWHKVKQVMKNPAVLDGRNIYDPEKLRQLGFKYTGIGRR